MPISKNVVSVQSVFRDEFSVKSEPLNDDPDYVPEPRFRMEWILGFLNFHRRAILGAVLVACVAYFLLRLNKPSPRVDENTASVTATDIDSNSQAAIALSSNLPEDSAARSFAPVESSASETTDEKINRLLDTASDWGEMDIPGAVVFLNKRVVELRELLQAQDLKPRQRKYCVFHFIDSVNLLAKLSQNTDAGLERIEELLAEVDQTYAESEDPEIAAAAHVVFVGYLASQFVAIRSEEAFESFQDALQERQAAILASVRSKERLSLVISDALSKVGDDARLRKIAIEHMSHIVDLRKPVAADLAIKLYFPKLILNLPARIIAEDREADEDVQLLLQQLKKIPDMPVRIYSVLASSIARYRDIGEDDKAENCIEQLRVIAPTIKTEGIRDDVLKGIDRLESYSPSK